ncbi:GntR family transcriptional regulator [Rhizobium leguminosarum]|uniref:GntR family transcriptional regulator n=1 Tax=Rhizobium leguminosarum TaxID=384 RepID=UPI003F96BEEA
MILKGGIVPGESITVASLAEAFEVIPMPVRNALTLLTSAGALTVISGRTIGIPKRREEEE